MKRKRRSQAADLASPIVALLTEDGPAHPKDVLVALRRQGRVGYGGATFHDAYQAALLAVSDGRLEHITRQGATGGGYFRVPGDSRPRWDT